MLTETIELLRGLGDPTRLRLLNLLIHKGELCVCDLERALDADQPFISRHLANLKHAGWVRSRRERTWVIYSLAPNLPEAARKILDAVTFEGEHDEVLMADRRRLDGLISSGACRSASDLVPLGPINGGIRE